MVRARIRNPGSFLVFSSLLPLGKIEESFLLQSLPFGGIILSTSRRFPFHSVPPTPHLVPSLMRGQAKTLWESTSWSCPHAASSWDWEFTAVTGRQVSPAANPGYPGVYCRWTGSCTTCGSPMRPFWTSWLVSRPKCRRAWERTRTPQPQWRCCLPLSGPFQMAQVSGAGGCQGPWFPCFLISWWVPEVCSCTLVIALPLSPHRPSPALYALVIGFELEFKCTLLSFCLPWPYTFCFLSC